MSPRRFFCREVHSSKRGSELRSSASHIIYVIDYGAGTRTLRLSLGCHAPVSSGYSCRMVIRSPGRQEVTGDPGGPTRTGSNRTRHKPEYLTPPSGIPPSGTTIPRATAVVALYELPSLKVRVELVATINPPACPRPSMVNTTPSPQSSVGTQAVDA